MTAMNGFYVSGPTTTLHTPHTDTLRVMALLEREGLIKRQDDPQRWHWLSEDIEQELHNAATE